MSKSYIHLISKILFCLLFFMGGVVNYILNPGDVMANYETLSYPGYLLYFSGTAKTLGIIALWLPHYHKTNNLFFRTLKERAYAGFLFVLILSLIAHIAESTGEFMGSIIGLVLFFLTYLTEERKEKKESK